MVVRNFILSVHDFILVVRNFILRVHNFILPEQWGPLLGHYPLFYGELGFLPNAYHPAECRNLPHGQAADATVTGFLNYMASRRASWTAWSFTPQHLIVDTTSFAPTTLDQAWTCGDTKSDAGMGELIKQYLAGS